MASPPPAAGAAPPAAAATAPAGASSKPAPSLAAWKSGADKMTTAAAGDHVSKTMPKPKPKQSSSKPAPNTKPWAEQTVEERYGTQPKLVNLTKQLKDTLRYLEAHQERGCITWEEITTQGIPLWYDTAEGGDLFNLLTSNPRVVATARGFAYQTEHGISDKASLLRHIRSHPEGVRATDIKDAHDNVLEDADKLRADGAVYKIYNAEFKVDVFFPVPQAHQHALPQDLANVYLKTELPTDPNELIAELTTKFKLRSALANASSSRKPISLLKPDKPNKKKRKTNPRHLTNTHLTGVLNQGEEFTSID